MRWIILITLILFCNVCLAISESDNFTLWGSSFSSGNPNQTELSSTNYKIVLSSIGEISDDGADSGNYILVSGFVSSDAGYLPSPSSVNIVISDSNVIITWDPVPGAISYSIYSSINAEGPFTENISGIFNGSQWTSTVSQEKLFFYVVAKSVGFRKTNSKIK